MTQLSDKIQDMHNRGMSYRQIQSELGCSKGTIAYHLGDDQKAKTRRRTTENQIKLREDVRKYKEESGCVDCDGKYPYFMLQFDHVGDDKLYNVAKLTGEHSSRKRVFEEIEKCEVVCGNCHSVRTFLRSLDPLSSNG
jgi:hypothetical protein